MNGDILERRLRSYYIIIIMVLLILVGRVWDLQIRQGSYFASLADGNRMRRIREVPTRGMITDCNGEVIIRSRPAFTVSLVPEGIPKESSAEVLVLLGEILHVSEEELNDYISKGRSAVYEPIRIMRDVDIATVIAIEENRMRLPGVFIEEEWEREYLYGDLTSHLTGYLGMISAEELQQFDSSYSNSDFVGKAGLERIYEQELRGIPGSETAEVNALSRPVQVLGLNEAIPGYNLVMSIDMDLQNIATQAFVEHMEVLKERDVIATDGTIVAIRPQTGEVVAMVSIPTYDAGLLLDSKERNKYYVDLTKDTRMPLFNRAVQGQYGAGSVIKPVLAVAMLEEGVVTDNQVFNATGTSEFGVRDWIITQGGAPFGNITLNEAIAISSNHYFAEFGKAVGIDRLSLWFREFGFGTETELIGANNEAAGLVPDRQWKRERFKNAASYDQVWYPSDTEQISIGQGFLTVTPLQLAVAFSAIANRGTIYQPTLIKQVIDPEGQVVQEFTPTIIRELDVKPETWESVIKGMTSTITHARGTARTAFAGFPLAIAGKTGSYEIPGQEANGLFVGFAPVDDPELVVVVLVEHGVGGGSAAAPIARAVFDQYFGFEN